MIATAGATTPPLETARLRLRPLAIDDAAAIQKTFPRWEIVEYMSASIPWPYPADGALVYIRDIALPAMASGQAWHWTLRMKSPGDPLIGAVSLMTTPNDNRGFWLSPEFHGQGLMTEACVAVTDYWFDALGQDVLRAPKASANRASKRLSERMGMRRVATEDRHFVSGRGPGEIWEISAEDWRRFHASGALERAPGR